MDSKEFQSVLFEVGSDVSALLRVCACAYGHFFGSQVYSTGDKYLAHIYVTPSRNVRADVTVNLNSYKL